MRLSSGKWINRESEIKGQLHCVNCSFITFRVSITPPKTRPKLSSVISHVVREQMKCLLSCRQQKFGWNSWHLLETAKKAKHDKSFAIVFSRFLPTNATNSTKLLPDRCHRHQKLQRANVVMLGREGKTLSCSEWVTDNQCDQSSNQKFFTQCCQSAWGSRIERRNYD